jgi:DNA-binding MarR family transcriptional regulator
MKATAAELRVDAVLTIMRSADILSRYMNISSKEYGPSQAGWGVLFVLVVRGGRLTPTEISKRILRSKHTVTQIVDTLEADGLVIRTSDAYDRRKRYIEITRKGLEIVKLGYPKRNESSNKALATLKKSETEQLIKILKRVNKYLVTQITPNDHRSTYKE